MAEKGRVTQLKQDLVVCTLTRKEACAKCRACVAGFSEQEMVIEAENCCGAKVGDWVEISLADNGFLGAVAVMYGIPLMGLMVGVLVGYFWLSPLLPTIAPELLSFGLGILLTAVCYFWIRSQEERWKSKKYRPEAVRITTPPEENDTPGYVEE